MRIPLSWLQEFVDITVPLEELAHRLTDAGLEVAAIERTGDWRHVYVGQVVGLQPHPNAERLHLATVDLGDRRVQVVCGAPNVALGQKVPLALEGAEVIHPQTGELVPVRRAVIRGVESAGMICSERELGISDDHSGIMVLPQDAPVGLPLSQYLGETVLELEVRPHRPDALSVLGVAREVAALTGQRIREPPMEYEEAGAPIKGRIAVEIADPELCPRYVAGLVEGVRVGPSPSWMQNRLRAAGLRPINNVVDVTNYVMLEMGQPLHAFDLHKLMEQRIVVRRAAEGETLELLDGRLASLTPEMLVIADAQRPVAVAGVMGGANSEVDPSTTAILLESANFHGPSIRRTAQALKVRTEASLRFEKGLSRHLPLYAARRAMHLLLRLCGGQAATGLLDVFPGKTKEPRITVSRRRLATVLGLDLPPAQVRQSLSSLGFSCRWMPPDTYVVRVPYWRSDVRIPEDVAEEVARVLSYERLPTALPRGTIPPAEAQPLRDFRERARDALAAAGLQEVITYPLLDKESLTQTLSPQEMATHPPLRVANPMSRELEYLRTTLRPGLLRVLARNLRVRLSLPGFFEVGRVFLPRADDLPREVEMAAIVMGGMRYDRWGRPSDEPVDLFDLKGALEAALDRLGIRARYRPTSHPIFLEGQTAAILVGGEVVGLLGLVHPRVAGHFQVEGRAFLAELDLERLLPFAQAVRRYRPFSRFPPVREDLAIIVDDGVPAQEAQTIIEESPLVTTAQLFDVYTGPPVPPGKKSLAFAITYQSLDHTPTDEEVAAERARIVARLREALGAVLRG
jgi:phenylalanyl-tRNA synthetase beta chain